MTSPETRAEVEREIVEWLREQADAWRDRGRGYDEEPGWRVHINNEIADAIERGEHRRTK